MRALDTKLVRDLVRMRAQLLAIALVVACGVGLFVGMRSMMHALEAARDGYYGRQRMADVFATAIRVPESVADRLRAIDGVRRVQTRVVGLATADMPGMTEAASLRLESIPDVGTPAVNGLHLRRGRLPQPGRGHEVVAAEAFAEAHDMRLGDELAVVVRGKRQRLRVVGVALSPEHTYSLPPGALLPDDRRYGVLWMRRAALAPSLDLEGAFDDVVLQLDPGASAHDVVDRVDAVLERYGGRGAILRQDQSSAFFVANELEQLATIGTAMPALFLLVAGFLLQIVVGRIVASQREQIATMKAVGCRDHEIAWHYGKFVAAVVAVGVVLGLGVALWIGSGMTAIYLRFYRFPDLPFSLAPREALFALAGTSLAAAVGAFAAIRATLRLPPAEAMHAPAPAIYRRTWLERLRLAHVVPISARIVLREIERSRLRAALSILGIALATSLVVTSRFMFDSMRHVMHVQFALAQREDLMLTFAEPRALGSLDVVSALPGVRHAEPFRAVPVEFRTGARERSGAITGYVQNGVLRRVLDANANEVRLPPEGLVLSSTLAEALGVRAGDSLTVAVLEGARRERSLQVVRLAQTYVGLAAWMDLGALCRLLGETDSASGALLEVDGDRIHDLHRAVKDTPIVAGVHARSDVMERFAAIVDDHVGTSMAISLAFALVLAFGVLFNAARITLAERARELASLRVLGFRRSETATILLGELALLTAVAIPLGLWLGRRFAHALATAPGFANEQFRFPTIVTPATDATAVVTVVAAACVSGFVAWRGLERMAIVDVLKSRD